MQEVVAAVVDLLCDIQSTSLRDLGVADITFSELNEIVILCKSISTGSRILSPSIEARALAWHLTNNLMLRVIPYTLFVPEIPSLNQSGHCAPPAPPPPRTDQQNALHFLIV